MNLLHVIGSMDPRSGGPCQGIRNLAPLAAEQGHAVEIVCLDDPRSEYLAGEKLKIHALGKGWGPWNYHPALWPWLERNLLRFDAVILNGLWLYTGYVLSRLAGRPGMPPYFVFPHGMLDPWFQRAPERRFKAIRNWIYWKLIEQRVIRNAGAVFFTCAEEMRLAAETFHPYQPKHQVNVGYGVTNPPEFNPRMTEAFSQKCPGLNGRTYFLFLGRIHPKKGVDLLIKAYAKVYGRTEVRSQKSEVRTESQVTDLRPPTSGPRVSGQESVVSSQRSTPISALESPKSAPSPLWGEGRGEVPPADSQLSSALPALVIAGPGLETPYGQQMQRLAAEVSGQISSLPSQVPRLRSPTSDLRPLTSESTPSPASGDSLLRAGEKVAEGRMRCALTEVPPADSQLSTLNSQPSIFFPGMLTGDAKWGALYDAETFVLTSHQENFGIAVAEALACGVPVLISNQINIWREIEEDKGGLVAPDTRAGSEQLFQQWESFSPEEKAVMKRAAQASYENRFGIALASKNLLATIEKLKAESEKA